MFYEKCIPIVPDDNNDKTHKTVPKQEEFLKTLSSMIDKLTKQLIINNMN